MKAVWPFERWSPLEMAKGDFEKMHGIYRIGMLERWSVGLSGLLELLDC